MMAIVKLIRYFATPAMLLASCAQHPESTSAGSTTDALAVGGPVEFEGPPAVRATPAGRGVDPIGPPANKLFLGAPNH